MAVRRCLLWFAEAIAGAATSPEVFLIARPNVDWPALHRYLQVVGNENRRPLGKGSRAVDERLIQIQQREHDMSLAADATGSRHVRSYFDVRRPSR